MQLPEPTKTAAHTSAVLRLKAARVEQNRAVARHEHPEGGSSDAHAAMAVRNADAEVAAREAWVEWVERPF